MADTSNQDFQTTLGPDAVFKGELTFDKGLRLHGRLEGKINTAGRLHIAKEAKMSADVEAGAIIVEGDVKGNLTAADRIEMKQSARYEGDLRTTKLVVDEGAVFSGNVTVGPEAIKSKGPVGSPTAGGAARNEPVRPSAVPQAQPVK
jgi:cytoskeletal protein CcmA (bactofilin family)